MSTWSSNSAYQLISCFKGMSLYLEDFHPCTKISPWMSPLGEPTLLARFVVILGNPELFTSLGALLFSSKYI